MQPEVEGQERIPVFRMTLWKDRTSAWHRRRDASLGTQMSCLGMLGDSTGGCVMRKSRMRKRI